MNKCKTKKGDVCTTPPFRDGYCWRHREQKPEPNHQFQLDLGPTPTASPIPEANRQLGMSWIRKIRNNLTQEV